MTTLREEIERGVRLALGAVLDSLESPPPDLRTDIDPVVRPTQDPKFGDYQSNVCLGLARRLGQKPRDLAADLSEILGAGPLGEVCEPPEVAGPGIINFRFRPEYLAARLASIQSDPRLGAPVEGRERVVVDYSSPNLAKEMHVGHLRSTIIGDTVSRLLEFLGHDVLRLNHVGDWGTQFGMLIQHLRDGQEPEAGDLRIQDLEAFYVAARQRFDSEPEFAAAARQAVVDLQSGEPEARRIWGMLCEESLRHAETAYARLGIRTGQGPGLLQTRGESFYNPYLAEVVADLRRQGLAAEDQGAICVYLDGFRNREGSPLPLIIQKGDGGYNYATTDLAGIRHRVDVERAARIVYVTDLRQEQHFEMVFGAARQAGWAPPAVRLDHLGFGMVMGPDRQPFRTRDGGTVRLVELLDEAVARARAVLEGDDERRREFTAQQREEIARAVGIGAVKYADLSHNVTSNYVFDWNTMLALEGNTAPYMLYAVARIRSIGRRAGIRFEDLPGDLRIILEHPSEVALARQLLEFPGVVSQAAADLRPHYLTDALYSLTRAFSTFYDRDRGVRIVDAEPEAVRLSRLRLCDLTARTLVLGLNLLGIDVLEQM